MVWRGIAKGGENMRLTKFWCGFLLGLCPFVIEHVFEYAFLQRGYEAIGGEFFVLALPFLIIYWRISTVQKQNKN